MRQTGSVERCEYRGLLRPMARKSVDLRYGKVIVDTGGTGFRARVTDVDYPPHLLLLESFVDCQCRSGYSSTI